MKKYLHYFLAAVIAPACLAGCSSDNDDAGATDAVMLKNVYSTGCKTGAMEASPMTRTSFAEKGFSEYIEYTSKDDGYVYFTHHNVLSDCCDEAIEVSIEREGSDIVIVESEDNLCNCICPFDVSFELGPFTFGKYTVKIKRQFDQASDSAPSDYFTFSFFYPGHGKVEVNR